MGFLRVECLVWRGPSLALLRIRSGPVIQLFNMSRGFWEAMQGMMGSCVRVNVSLGRDGVDVQGFIVCGLCVCLINIATVNKPLFIEMQFPTKHWGF